MTELGGDAVLELAKLVGELGLGCKRAAGSVRRLLRSQIVILNAQLPDLAAETQSHPGTGQGSA